MANLTKSYETVFVLSNKLTEEATAELVKKFTDLIAANGTIDSVDECKFLFELVLQFEKLTYCLHSVLFLKRVDCVEAFADLLLSLQ